MPSFRKKVFRHFTQEKKDMLTALSLFDVFTLSQAKYMYSSGDTTAMMREEEESGLFLYLVKGTTGSYRFFPVMRQFLAAEFLRPRPQVAVPLLPQGRPLALCRRKLPRSHAGR